MKIVFDTNIYLAALLSTSLCFDLVWLALGPESVYEVCISTEIIEELKKSVEKKTKGYSSSLLEIEQALNERAEWVVSKEKLNVVKGDKNDNKILECAVAPKADLIVTMDKDLLKLKSFRKIGVVHPKTFYFMLEKK